MSYRQGWRLWWGAGLSNSPGPSLGNPVERLVPSRAEAFACVEYIGSPQLVGFGMCIFYPEVELENLLPVTLYPIITSFTIISKLMNTLLWCFEDLGCSSAPARTSGFHPSTGTMGIGSFQRLSFQSLVHCHHVLLCCNWDSGWSQTSTVSGV